MKALLICSPFILLSFVIINMINLIIHAFISIILALFLVQQFYLLNFQFLIPKLTFLLINLLILKFFFLNHQHFPSFLIYISFLLCVLITLHIYSIDHTSQIQFIKFFILSLVYLESHFKVVIIIQY